MSASESSPSTATCGAGPSRQLARAPRRRRCRPPAVGRPGAGHDGAHRLEQDRQALAGLVVAAEEADGRAVHATGAARQRRALGEGGDVHPVGDDHRVAAEVLDLNPPGEVGDRDPAADLLQPAADDRPPARSATSTGLSPRGRWRRSGPSRSCRPAARTTAAPGRARGRRRSAPRAATGAPGRRTPARTARWPSSRCTGSARCARRR